MYDFPALVEYVCDATGYDKVRLPSSPSPPTASSLVGSLLTSTYTMVLFADIVKRLAPLPSLYGRLTQAQLLSYFDVATRFAPLLDLSRSSTTGAHLPSLPDNMALVLSIHVKLPLDDIFELWSALGALILAAKPGELVVHPSDTDAALTVLGPAHDIGEPSSPPPVNHPHWPTLQGLRSCSPPSMHARLKDAPTTASNHVSLTPNLSSNRNGAERDDLLRVHDTPKGRRTATRCFARTERVSGRRHAYTSPKHRRLVGQRERRAT